MKFFILAKKTEAATGRVLYDKLLFENFVKLTGKDFCRSSPFLMKLQVWGLELYLKKDFDTGVFLSVLLNLSEQLLGGTSVNNIFWIDL